MSTSSQQLIVGFDKKQRQRNGAAHLAKPYHKLMNMIYITKTIPNQWKVARILPLHKKGQRTTLKTTDRSGICVWQQKSLKNVS
jgi:hypothetical protein